MSSPYCHADIVVSLVWKAQITNGLSDFLPKVMVYLHYLQDPVVINHIQIRSSPLHGRQDVSWEGRFTFRCPFSSGSTLAPLPHRAHLLILQCSNTSPANTLNLRFESSTCA